MSNDKNKEAKLLALGYMSVSKKNKRANVCVVTLTAMHTHSEETYAEHVDLNERLNAIKEKCKKRNIRFSKTAFAFDALKKATIELERTLDISF